MYLFHRLTAAPSFETAINVVWPMLEAKMKILSGSKGVCRSRAYFLGITMLGMITMLEIVTAAKMSPGTTASVSTSYDAGHPHF